MSRYTDYDAFADIYNRHWGGFADHVITVLDQLGLAALQPGEHVLDVCCGSGQLAAQLVERGLQVTGVDGSAEMIENARANAPGAEFIVADAREFTIDACAALAVSTYDSLNHVMELGGLTQVFSRVAAALLPGGRFIFDLNMEEGFVERWRGTFAIDEADELIVTESSYDADDKLGTVKLILLERNGELWRRRDLTLTQRAYTTDEVTAALESSGFVDIVVRNAAELMDGWQAGRSFFSAKLPD